MFAYGVNDDATFTVLTKEEIEKIVKHMGNIAHNNLSQAVDIDHAVLEYNGHPVLFVYVPEQREKPIFLRGKDYHESYCRANGQTRKMSELQVRNMIATSQGLSFEERIAKRDLTKDDESNSIIGVQFTLPYNCLRHFDGLSLRPLNFVSSLFT